MAAQTFGKCQSAYSMEEQLSTASMAFDCFISKKDWLQLESCSSIAMNGLESFEVREPDCTAALAERLYQDSRGASRCIRHEDID